VSERSAAFTPLPLGTLCVALRIFPSGGKGSTVKRPDRRRAEAALWRAAKAEGRAPTNRQLRDAPSDGGRRMNPPPPDRGPSGPQQHSWWKGSGMLHNSSTGARTLRVRSTIARTSCSEPAHPLLVVQPCCGRGPPALRSERRAAGGDRPRSGASLKRRPRRTGNVNYRTGC